MEPSEGSERMSERLSRSSTKYGPSVCSGVTTQAGKVAEFAVDDAGTDLLDCTCIELDFLGMHTASIAAPTPLNKASTSLRFRSLPNLLALFFILLSPLR